jgi:hemolysin III
LGVLRGPWGLALLIIVWALALAGVAFKVIGGAAAHPKLSTGVYLAMGWVLLLAAGPVWHLMPVAGLMWLLAGGVAFTAGVAFFRAERVRYVHFIWHLFVLAGTVCHFVAVMRYDS